MSRFGVAPHRLGVIPNTLEEEWYVHDISTPSSKDYVLTVAGEAPSKNLNRALEAFALFHRKNPNLSAQMKIAGVKPAFHAAFASHAQDLGIGAKVEFLPYLSDEEIRKLYRGAAVLFMPSLAEGFGIPVLEAMASGVPVAASNAASLPEVGGDAALYFDPTSTEQMAQILHQILFDSGLRARMADLGRIQARKYHPAVIRASIQRFWDKLTQADEMSPATELAAC